MTGPFKRDHSTYRFGKYVRLNGGITGLLQRADYYPVGQRAERRSWNFVVQGRPDLCNSVMDFRGNANSVEPLAFTSTLKDVKRPNHNA